MSGLWAEIGIQLNSKGEKMIYREALDVFSEMECNKVCTKRLEDGCAKCSLAFMKLTQLVDKEEKHRWHNSKDTVPTIGVPIIIMRVFENIRTSEKHKEYDAGHLNECWEILTNDCDYVCDYDDVDAWKYIEEHEG